MSSRAILERKKSNGSMLTNSTINRVKDELELMPLAKRKHNKGRNNPPNKVPGKRKAKA